jgi:hypothetical protein
MVKQFTRFGGSGDKDFIGYRFEHFPEEVTMHQYLEEELKVEIQTISEKVLKKKSWWKLW